jgi:hypothetical protein
VHQRCKRPPRHRAETHGQGYLSHYLDAERDVACLLDWLADRDARIAELAARLQVRVVDVLAAVTSWRRIVFPMEDVVRPGSLLY